MHPVAVVLAILLVSARRKQKEEEVSLAHDSDATGEAGGDVSEALKAARLSSTTVVTLPRTSMLTVTRTLDFVLSHVARVGPLVNGRILSMRVQQGDAVGANALLAATDSPPVGRARADYLDSVSRLNLADEEGECRLVSEGVTSAREVAHLETARPLFEPCRGQAAEELRHRLAADGEHERRPRAHSRRRSALRSRAGRCPRWSIGLRVGHALPGEHQDVLADRARVPALPRARARGREPEGAFMLKTEVLREQMGKND